MKDQGAIIISHRLASAKLADKIFVLHDGVISEQGTHDELMKSKGLYYAMFSSQASWYNDKERANENI
jgi:ATP-binding cassette subfamily B protein